MNQITDAPFVDAAAGVVGRTHVHESAALHVAGTATYIDDLPELSGTLHAALGLSPLAHGRLRGIAVDKLRALPGVVDVVTAADIPGANNCGPIVHDDPILAQDLVQYLGQPMFAVLAESREAARRAAARARDFVDIEPLEPVLTVRAAHAKQSYVVPPMHLQRGDAEPAPKPVFSGPVEERMFHLSGLWCSACGSISRSASWRCLPRATGSRAARVEHCRRLC